MKGLLSKLKHKLIIYAHRREQLESVPLRRYFSENFGITVGLYSYGCFDTRRIPANTTIGRYCSFAPTAQIFNGNHGISFISTHPYLYNIKLGMVATETITRTACTVEDDVWLGHNCIILPSVKVVGRGSVVAAGAVVTKDVPRYAVVAGNPAKVIKYRFPPEVIDRLEEMRWWLNSKEDLMKLAIEDPELAYRTAERIMECKE